MANTIVANSLWPKIDRLQPSPRARVSRNHNPAKNLPPTAWMRSHRLVQPGWLAVVNPPVSSIPET